MIDDTFDRIAELFPSANLTDTERSVVLHLINLTPQQLNSTSIRSVADACFTSMTTVTRTAKKLGYAGFREMIFGFRFFKSGGDKSIISSDELHAKLTYSNEHLDWFYRILDKKELIGLKGEGYSHLISEYIQHKLLGRGHAAIEQSYLDHDQFAQVLSDRLSLMIVVSKSGSTQAAIDTARECSTRGIPLAVFVGNPNSPVADMADMLFLVEDDQPLDPINVRPGSFTGCCILAFEQMLYRYENEWQERKGTR